MLKSIFKNNQVAGDNNNTLTLTQTVPAGFSSMYLTNPSTSGQIYVANAGMVLKCNTNDPICIKPNDVDGLTMNYDGSANFNKTVSVWSGVSGSYISSLVSGNTVSNLILTNPVSNTNLLVQLEPKSGSLRYDSTTNPLVLQFHAHKMLLLTCGVLAMKLAC